MMLVNGPDGDALDISGTLSAEFEKYQAKYKKGYIPPKELEAEERAMDHMAFYLQPYNGSKI